MPKGKKFCLKCNEGVGCRTKICPKCGEPFSKAPAPAHRPSDILPDPPPPPLSGPPPLPGSSELPAEEPFDEDPDADQRGKLCIDHPEYQAIKPPKFACEGCWRAYLKERFGERIAPLDTAKVLTITDEKELTSFIANLIGARTKSEHGGGCYSAFCHVKGGAVLQIDVHLSWNKGKD